MRCLLCIMLACSTLCVASEQSKIAMALFDTSLHPQGEWMHGYVTFKEVPQGVLVEGHISGLPEGKYGFHIHEFGICNPQDAYESAGGHDNPTRMHHGGPASVTHHVGDLGNLVFDSQGIAHYQVIMPDLHLRGDESVVGKALLIHQQEDDLETQPTGNSGPRIACGIIREIFSSHAQQE